MYDPTDIRRNAVVNSAFPWLAAGLVLLAALLVKWPEPVLSEDQKAVERLPANRIAVEQARQEFVLAEDAYKEHIRTYDIGGMLERLKGSVLVARDGSGSSAALQEVLELLPEMLRYVEVLRVYAESGEKYLAALQLYDDELMAWTRSLGAPSEGLRDDTFPIVEHLKLYPPPLGLKVDPSLVTASQVVTQETHLRESLSILSSSSLDRDGRRAQLDALDRLIEEVRASGRSIEQKESLHADYRKFLQTYDDAVGRVVANAGGGATFSFVSVAVNAAVGLMLLGGLGLIFSARGKLSKA
jgi:hypothetical protein